MSTWYVAYEILFSFEAIKAVKKFVVDFAEYFMKTTSK